jgi:shikimate kinase
VVWLVARPETLANRLLRDEKQIRMRPSLTAAGTLAEISDVLAARIPLYEAAADLEVDTENRSVAAIADHVTRVWLDWRAAHPTPSEAGGSPR